MAVNWWDKPHVFKRYGAWRVTRPGIAGSAGFFTWGEAMYCALEWWHR